LGLTSRRWGLTIFDVEWLPIHGGSQRVFAALDRNAAATDALRRVLTNEAHAGMHQRDFYLAFANRAADVREKLQQLLKDLRRDGKRVAAYGASAKGSTLLSYCGIGNDLLDFVVDRSPHKQGRYMPGVPLPIV